MTSKNLQEGDECMKTSVVITCLASFAIAQDIINKDVEKRLKQVEDSNCSCSFKHHYDNPYFIMTNRFSTNKVICLTNTDAVLTN